MSFSKSGWNISVRDLIQTGDLKKRLLEKSVCRCELVTFGSGEVPRRNIET
jgi:hypothetical protein